MANWSDGELLTTLMMACDGWLLWDAPGQRIDFSDAWPENLGYSPGELDPTFEAFFALIHPEDRTQCQAALAALTDGTMHHLRLEARLRTRRGSYRWSQLRAQTHPDRAGHFIMVRHDITDRKLAEVVLRESEMRWRTLFDQETLGITLLDWSGLFYLVNAGLCRMLDYPLHDLLDKSYADITHPDDLESSHHLLVRLRRGMSHPIQLEKRYLRRDGSPIWVRLTASTVYDSGQQPRYGLIIIEDISARKQAEEARRQAEHDFRALVATTPDVLLRLRPDLTIEFANHALAGKPPESLIGTRLPEYALPGEAVTIEQAAARALRTRKGIPFEVRLAGPYGAATQQEMHLAPLLDDQDEVVALVASAHDITALKRAQFALLESQSTLLNLMSNVSGMAFRAHMEGNLDFVSEGSRMLTGYDARELVNPLVVDYRTLFHPEDRDRVQSIRRSALKTGEPYRVSYRIVHRYGDVRWVQEQGRLTYLPDGEQVVEGLLMDISDLKRTEDALRHYARGLEMLVEIDRAILAADAPNTIVPTALQHLRTLVDCDAAAVRLFDEDMRFARLLARITDPGIQLTLPDDQPVEDYPPSFIETLRSGSFYLGQNLHLLPELAPYEKLLREAGMTTYAAVPMLIDEQLVGELIFATRNPATLRPEQIELVSGLTNQLAIAIRQARLNSEVRAGRDELQTLLKRIVDVQEIERRLIAHELHDEFGQILTSLNLSLQLAQRQPPDVMRERIATAQATVADLLRRVRQLSLELRPAMLDDLGLLPALLWHFDAYTQKTQIVVNFRHMGEDVRFDAALELAIFRIAQEALTNIARYAHVAQVDVILWHTNTHVRIEIQDEGVGFDMEALMARGHSLGLLGMRERAASLGGTFTVESAPGTGTRLRAEWSLPGREASIHNSSDQGDVDDSDHAGG